MSNDGKVSVRFVKERLTRNTVRYEEMSTHYIGSLYVRKETFNGSDFPDNLTVTLEFKV